MNKSAVGGVLLILSSIFIALFNYALSIILSWTLDPVAYGVIGVSQSFLFLGGWFLISGFPWVMTKALAKADSDEVPSIYPLLKSAFYGNLLLGGLIAGGLWLATVTGLLRLSSAYSVPMGWVAVIIFLLGGRLGFDAILQGRLEFGKLSLVRTIEVVAQFSTALLLVWYGYGVSGALGGFAIGTAISLGLAVWFAKDIPFLKISSTGFPILAALRPALPFLLANLCGVLLVNVDLLAVKFLTPSNQADLLVGQYQVAAVLARIPYFLSQSIISIIFPIIASHADNRLQATRTGRQTLQLMISVVMGLGLILVAAPEATIAFFFPATYVAIAPTLRLLAVAISFIILAQALAAILQARGKASAAAMPLLLAVAIQMLALIWGVPQYEIIGAALATVLAGLVALVTMLLTIHRTFPTLIKVSPGQVATQISAFALLGLLLAWLPSLNRLYTALWISVGISVYTAVLLVLWRDKFRGLYGSLRRRLYAWSNS